MKNIISLVVLFILILGFGFVFYLFQNGTLNNFTEGQERCGLENCHGTDLSCGSKIPQVCNAIYQIGDKCRQFANCENINGNCRLNKTSQFEKCKSCVDECIKKFDNSEEVFACEEKCN